jgi:hypothetical protein
MDHLLSMEKEKSRPGSSALGAVHTLFLADRQAAGPADIGHSRSVLRGRPLGSALSAGQAL